MLVCSDLQLAKQLDSQEGIPPVIVMELVDSEPANSFLDS